MKKTTEAPVVEAGANGQTPERRLLTRAEILDAHDVQTEAVNVPEWGGDVLVRSMTGDERDRFEAEAQTTNSDDPTANYQRIRARLAARTIVDEDGNRVFSEQDIEKLGSKNAWALTRVLLVAARLAALDDKDIEQLAKQLKGGPSASSGTG
jgi:hypothetical protein